MKYALVAVEIKMDASEEAWRVWKVFLRDLQTHPLNNEYSIHIHPNVLKVSLDKTIQPLLELLSLAKERKISCRISFLDEPLSWVI